MILEIAAAALLSCDPRLVSLFTPHRPVVGAYDVCTTAEPIDRAVASMPDEHAAPAETLDALDAFGAAGPYDRGALNRLYDGRRPKVVRAWREADGHFESLTFVSPYPNPELTELNSGTLVIVYRVR